MDESGAVWIPTANMWPNRYGHRPTHIILHGTGSQGSPTAQNIGNFFANPTSEVSAHYVIGRDGTLVQCVNEHDAAWANGVITQGADPWWTINPNLITISIEHVNALDNGLALTPLQQQTSFALIKNICQRWQIPPRKADGVGGITGHFSIDPVYRTHCPGNYPWDALFNYLGATSMLDIGNPAVANYFTLLGTNRWECKVTKCILRDGILAFYRNLGNIGLNGITLLGLPVSNEEQVLDTVGHPIVDHQGEICTRQRFERGEVTYDPSHLLDSPPGASSCYMTHIDDIFKQAEMVASYAKQVQTLQRSIDEIQKQNTVLQQQKDAAVASSGLLSQELTTAQAEIKQLQINQPTQKITSTEVLSYLEQLLRTTKVGETFASQPTEEFTAN